MGRPKRAWITVGYPVTDRRTGRVGELLEFRGRLKADRLRVRWKDTGQEQWVRRKDVRHVGS